MLQLKFVLSEFYLVFSLTLLAAAIIAAIVLGTRNKISKDSNESFIMHKH